MVRFATFCLAFAAASLPSSAYALDREFYVYDGISAVENAFRYVALFFAHELYGVLVMTVGVVSLGFGFVWAYIKSNGDPSVVGRTFFALCIAMGVYVGGIAQKGNIIIYDPVANDTATVPDVPDAIVFLAGTVSSVERAAIEIANLSAPRVHADLANGTIFDVLRATHEVEPIGDDYLFRSLQNYYTDCIRIAKAVPANNLSDQTLKRATDLQAEWAKAAVPTVDTTYYNTSVTNGEVATCETVWNTILSPRITDPTTFIEVEEAVCRMSGFSPAVPGQLVRCREFLNRIPEEIFGQAAGTDRFALYRGMALSGAMYESAIRLSPSAAMKAELNREVVTNGMGLAESWRQLGPTVRASFIAAAVTALPIMFVFLITPIWGRVLQVTLAFFAFVAVWSVIDVGLTQVTHGMAVDAFEEVRRYELGSNSFFTAPTSTVKALSIFGNARAISLALSSLLIVTVFGLSGSSFSSLTGNLSAGAESAGKEAAQNTVNPVGSTQLGRAATDASAFKASASLNDNQLADMEASAINGNMRSQSAGRSLGPGAATTGWSQGARQGASDRREAERIASSDMTPSQLGAVEGGVAASRDMQRAKAIEARSKDLAGELSIPTDAATDRITRAQAERELGKGAGLEGSYNREAARSDGLVADRNAVAREQGTALGEARSGFAPGAGVRETASASFEEAAGDARAARRVARENDMSRSAVSEVQRTTERRQSLGAAQGAEAAATALGTDTQTSAGVASQHRDASAFGAGAEASKDLRAVADAGADGTAYTLGQHYANEDAAGRNVSSTRSATTAGYGDTAGSVARGRLLERVSSDFGLSPQQVAEDMNGGFAFNFSGNDATAQQLREAIGSDITPGDQAILNSGGVATVAYGDDGVAAVSLSRNTGSNIDDEARHLSGSMTKMGDQIQFANGWTGTPGAVWEAVQNGDGSFFAGLADASDQQRAAVAQNLTESQHQFAVDQGQYFESASETTGRQFGLEGSGSLGYGYNKAEGGDAGSNGNISARASAALDRGSNHAQGVSRAFSVDRQAVRNRELVDRLADAIRENRTDGYVMNMATQMEINHFRDEVMSDFQQFGDLAGDTASRTDRPDDDMTRSIGNPEEHQQDLKDGDRTHDSNESRKARPRQEYYQNR